MILLMKQICICLLLLAVEPFILGKCMAVICKMKTYACMEIIYGWLLMLAVFEVIGVSATLLKCSLTQLCLIYSVVLFVLTVVLLVFAILQTKKEKSLRNVKKEKRKFQCNIYIVAAIVLICLQVGMAIAGMHTDADDAYYLGTATTSLATDTLYVYQPDNGLVYTSLPYRYVFSALTLFWAYISKLAAVHPAILVHSVLQPLFILFFYSVMWNLAKYMFHDFEKESLFLLFINFFQIFGFTSIYTQSTFLLFRNWQGKAMLPNMIFPVLLLLFLELGKKKAQDSIWIMVFLTVVAACCCSSMAVPLCLLAVGVETLVLLVMRRKWRAGLYGLLCCLPCIVIGISFLVLR